MLLDTPVAARRIRRLALAALLILALGSLPAGARAADQQRCFPETGYCIGGAIRSYWERNGGLAVFGYPITPLQAETVEGSWTGPTQWFERDRLEDHSNEGKGVLAGRLGAAARAWIYGEDWQSVPGDAAPIPGCRFFHETRRNLCGPFLSYWENNGGLERFGYPISASYQEAIDGQSYTVQYFERRRMELHPENAGTPYEVLLGLLGAGLRAVDGCPRWFFAPAPFKCAQGEPTRGDGAVERFMNGVMVWTRDPDRFVIVSGDGSYWVAAAPYQLADAPAVTDTPPGGLYAPTSGFGDIWRGRIVVSGPSPLSGPLRERLGWATEPEHGAQISEQCVKPRAYFEQGCYLGNPTLAVLFYGPSGGQIPLR